MTADNRTNGQIVAKALVAHCEEHKMPFPRGSVKKIVEALRVAGRLAGEPTETQVEAAVHAAWVKSREFRGVGGQAEFAPPWEFQQVIRAALESAARAAQEAAPQVDEEHFHIWSELPCKPGRCRMEPAPVLPSSGVDEDKLAEVIQASAAEWGDSERVNNALSQYIARAVAEWLEEQGQ